MRTTKRLATDKVTRETHPSVEDAVERLRKSNGTEWTKHVGFTLLDAFERLLELEQKVDQLNSRVFPYIPPCSTHASTLFERKEIHVT